jgi:hypothetical protein
MVGLSNNGIPLLKTFDGGDKWSVVYVDPDALFREIHFLNADTGFIFTTDTLLKTNDGGQSWIPVLQKSVRDIFFPTSKIGFAAAEDGIFKTVDQGNTWRLNYSSNFISLGACCIDHKTRRFSAIALDGLQLGISATFQNRNREPSDDNLPNNKA